MHKGVPKYKPEAQAHILETSTPYVKLN